MKIIPMVPACQNLAELKKLTELTCECMHPEMIILFGYYAGMELASIHHGYELLVLTKNAPLKTYREVLNYLNIRYHPEERTEKHLSVFLFTTEFFQQMTSRSYLFMSARRDGILLYQSEDCKIAEHFKWKPTYAHRRLINYTGHALKMGKALLQDAKRNYELQVYRLTAFHLYQAAMEFTHAVTFAHYGFIPENQKDLFLNYTYIRQCSKELSELWNTPQDLTGALILRRLVGYKRYISAEYIHIKPEGLPICIEKLEQFEKIAEHFCTEREQLLNNLIVP